MTLKKPPLGEMFRSNPPPLEILNNQKNVSPSAALHSVQMHMHMHVTPKIVNSQVKDFKIRQQQ